VAFIRYVVPLGSIIFLVVGLIFLGVASPTEAAAVGALGSFLLGLGLWKAQLADGKEIGGRYPLYYGYDIYDPDWVSGL